MTGKAKILVVDDHPKNIEALSELIAAPDVEIHSATDADGALALIAHNDFALALLDVQMPHVSGFELARMVRGVRRYRHLPIIFVTAHSEDREVVFSGYETGAVDLLFKPLDPHAVRTKVRVFVELHLQKQMLREHAEELDRLRVQADAANLAKGAFLANMSHEIRTPLAAVLGFSEMLAQGRYPGNDKQECVDAIRRNSQLLLKLIDDILDLSKIEANRLDLERSPFDMARLLKDIESTLSFKAGEKGVQLRFHVPEGMPLGYVSDQLRIKQVFLNIIGNAIKFSDKGLVEVEVHVEDADDGHDLLRATVRDQGRGMTPEESRRLFRPFVQADSSTRRQYGGSGLGLVISRQIARALQGDLQLVESRLGEGSVFEFTLRLERRPLPSLPQVSAKDAAKTTDFHGRRLLLVDDAPDNLTLLSLYLKPTRAELTFARDGRQAVEAFQQQVPDAILMDVQMPVMDGREATEMIRSLGYTGPIIALTAHAQRSEHAKCRDVGCDDVLVKPVTLERLLGMLRKHLPPMEDNQDLTAPPSP